MRETVAFLFSKKKKEPLSYTMCMQFIYNGTINNLWRKYDSLMTHDLITHAFQNYR